MLASTPPLVLIMPQHIAFKEGRGNLIIEYASSPEITKVVSFVGSHLDVVPADPKDWSVFVADDDVVSNL
jgi:acetylornithine deacetylase/succinyl-diaminopimelate desuccinylase-like protein